MQWVNENKHNEVFMTIKTSLIPLFPVPSKNFADFLAMLVEKKIQIVAFFNLRKLDNKQSILVKEFIKKWNVTFWGKYGQIADGMSKLEREDQDDDWSAITYAILGFSAFVVVIGTIGVTLFIRARRK